MSTLVTQKIQVALSALTEALAEVAPPPAPSPADAEGMLSTSKLALRLGVHTRTIHTWRAAGCPAIQIGPRGYRYDLEAVRTWLAARRGGAR